MNNKYCFISIVFVMVVHTCLAQTDTIVDRVPTFPDPPVGFNVQHNHVPHGKLTVVQYNSMTLGKRREMNVYTPPGYSSGKKYPVLYLLHGLGEDYRQWTEWCQADNIVDNLIGLYHPEIFANIGGFSSAPNTNKFGGMYTDVPFVPDIKAAREKLKLLWLGCGNSDGLFRISEKAHQYLKEVDIPHVWNVDANGHDNIEWDRNLYLFLINCRF